jgi:hypothetical protein
MSIFDDKNKVTGAWMKFSKIGDSIEGTLVERRELPSTLTGEMQQIYEIKISGDVIIDGVKQQVAPGDVFLVGGKKFMDNQLKHVRVGQVIGLKYENDIPSKKPGMYPTKCIQVYANAKIVDEDWLNSVDQTEDSDGTLDGATDMYSVKDSAQKESFLNDLDRADTKSVKDQIYALAQEKLGASSEIDDIQLKVMEHTKKALIDENLPSVLKELKAL